MLLGSLAALRPVAPAAARRHGILRWTAALRPAEVAIRAVALALELRAAALVSRTETIGTAPGLADGEVGRGPRRRRLPIRPRQRRANQRTVNRAFLALLIFTIVDSFLAGVDGRRGNWTCLGGRRQLSLWWGQQLIRGLNRRLVQSLGVLIRLVVRHGAGLAMRGVALGLIGGLLLTRSLESLLYEVNPRDPVVFVGVGFGLGLVALLAACIPARRAATADPLVAMRPD